jgi:hypothetical protein
MLLIYLDNCSYNRPFDNQAQVKVKLETEAKLYIQAGVRAGHYALCWSYMLDFENNANPYDERQTAIAQWRRIALEYCAPSDSVLERGREIMRLGVHTSDALHISCAAEKRCDYFITTDKKLLNKVVPSIIITNPIDFIRETEDLA